MIKGGKGGDRTITGLNFEKKVALPELLATLPNYRVAGKDVFFKGKRIAEVFQKHGFYKEFLEPKGINYTQFLTKKLLPDGALFVLTSKKLFIIEVKFQEVEGSVDEKLQTGDFKRKQYQKLVDSLGIQVEFFYVLSDWFKNEKYQDTLQYVESVGCKYFFNVIPLDALGLPMA